MSERQAKRMKKNEVGERKEQDKDLIRELVLDMVEERCL